MAILSSISQGLMLISSRPNKCIAAMVNQLSTLLSVNGSVSCYGLSKGRILL